MFHIKKVKLTQLFNLVIFSTLFMFLSCENLQLETIEPIAEPKTTAEIQAAMQRISGENSTEYIRIGTSNGEDGDGYVNIRVKYKVKDFDVNYSDQPNNAVDQIGQTFLNALGKFFFLFKANYDVKISDINIDLSELTIDKEMIKDIRIKNIFLEFSDKTPKTNSFKFINNFAIKGIIEKEIVEEQVMSIKEKGKEAVIEEKSSTMKTVREILLSYNEVTGKKCDFKCINFSSVYEGNLLDLLDQKNRIKISPSLAVNNTMSKKMDLIFDGYIEFDIKLKLNF